jgi:hypothetical protein
MLARLRMLAAEEVDGETDWSFEAEGVKDTRRDRLTIAPSQSDGGGRRAVQREDDLAPDHLQTSPASLSY